MEINTYIGQSCWVYTLYLKEKRNEGTINKF